MIYSIIGIVGAALILFGFYRVSVGRWTGKSKIYELDNLAGALLLIIYTFHHQAYISVVVNVIWAIVALKGLTPYVERKK